MLTMVRQLKRCTYITISILLTYSNYQTFYAGELLKVPQKQTDIVILKNKLAKLLGMEDDSLNDLTIDAIHQEIKQRFIKPNATQLKYRGTEREDLNLKEKEIEIRNLFDEISTLEKFHAIDWDDFLNRAAEKMAEELRLSLEKMRLEHIQNQLIQAEENMQSLKTDHDNNLTINEQSDRFLMAITSCQEAITSADTYFRDQTSVLPSTITLSNDLMNIGSHIRTILTLFPQHSISNYGDLRIELTNNISLLKNYPTKLSNTLRISFNITSKNTEKFEHFVEQLGRIISGLYMWAHEHLKKLEEQYQQYTIAEASQPKSNIDNAEAIRYQTVQEVVDRAQSAVNKLIDKFDNFSQLDDIRIHILSTIEFADKYFRKENTISDATIKFINNVSSFMQSIREILKNSTKNKALDHSDIIKLTNNIKLLKNYTNNISDQLQQIFNVKDEDKQEFNHIMQQLRNTIATLCSWATDQAQTLEKSYKSQQETRKKEKQEQQGQNTNSYSNMLKRFFNYIRGH